MPNGWTIWKNMVLDPVDRRVMDQLHEVKADLLQLRRAIWPLRDAIATSGPRGECPNQ